MTSAPSDCALARLVLRSDHPGRCLAFYQALGLRFTALPDADSPISFAARAAGLLLEIKPASRRCPARPAPALSFEADCALSAATGLARAGFRVLALPDPSDPGSGASALDPDGRSVEIRPRGVFPEARQPSPPQREDRFSLSETAARQEADSAQATASRRRNSSTEPAEA